jgi:hypothetical protein
MVQDKVWPVSAIDCFILAKLEHNKLRPSPAADKRTLIRRATLDLIGLPPTPDEIADFLNDDSSGAFATVVDRLLASPHYGERWGRLWLDLVRYSDDFDEAWRYRDWVIDAFNRDLPYDQFVIHQIAGDLLREGTCGVPARRDPPAGPSIENLQADPGAPGHDKLEHEQPLINADGIVATTMLSLGPWSGIDRKKRLTDIVDDQLDTISRVFMGLTLACARCHDHKFDPITTADYYGLAGMFFSSRVISDEGYLSHGTPRLRIPLVGPAEVERHRLQFARVQQLEAQLADAVEREYAKFARSLVPDTSRYLIGAWEYEHRPADERSLSLEDWSAGRGLHAFALRQWIEYLQAAPLVPERLLTMPARDYDGEPGVHAWMAHAERPWWGVNSTDKDVAIETFVLPARSASVNPGDAGGAVAWKSPISGTVRITGKLSDGDPHDGTGVSWIIDQTTATGRRELSSGSLSNGSSRRLNQGRTPERLEAVAVEPGDMIWLQVWLRSGDAHYDITKVDLTITADTPHPCPAATREGLGVRGVRHGEMKWDLTHDVVDNLLDGNPHDDGTGNADVWHFYDLAGNNRQKRMPAVEPIASLWKAAVTATSQDEPGSRQTLATAAARFQQAIEAASDGPLTQDLTGPRSPFWAHVRDDAKYLQDDARASLAKLADDLRALKASLPPLPSAHGIQEGGLRFSLYPGIGDAPMHVRGSYDQLGDRVPRRFPHVLAAGRQPVIESGSGRLELARWLASAEHPLTARVAVNRVWQHHFGEGIVRTPSNFGVQGEQPSHPELLDYLAQEFIDSGWSVKSLHRIIMSSSAYQQDSRGLRAEGGGSEVVGASGETARTASDTSGSQPSALRPPHSADPANVLLWRMNRRRLDAESLRDGLLAIAGELDRRPHGAAEKDPQSPRRTVYLRTARTDRTGFGPLFDGADACIHVEKRTVSTVAPQALFLMNNPWVAEIIARIAQRVELVSVSDCDRRTQLLYEFVYGREPTVQELDLGREFLASQVDKQEYSAHSMGAWPTYVHALVLANEFLYAD